MHKGYSLDLLMKWIHSSVNCSKRRALRFLTWTDGCFASGLGGQ